MDATNGLKENGKAFRIIAYLLGAAHIVFGVSKLVAPADLTKEFTELWHFPLWFMYFVGVAQLLGGIGLIIRQLRMPSAFAMALIMVGAMATCIVSGQWVNVLVCFVVMVLCLITFFTRVRVLAIELAVERGYVKP